MKILTNKYFEKYKKNLENFKVNLESFKKSNIETDFDYLTESSSVYSSNIEWNSLDLNSFMNLKINKKITKDVKEINNLIEAYKFAQNNKLNEINLLKTHEINSKNLLIKSSRWVYRNDKVWVFWKNWLIYLAIEPEFVKEKMIYIFEDIDFLLNEKLSNEEVFYYSSLIHLSFVHIHPFSDWNGRTARLIEKWFLTQKLWKDFWKLSSEKYYKENISKYYENINLWVNYYELDYEKCMYFLLMLPKSLIL